MLKFLRFLKLAFERKRSDFEVEFKYYKFFYFEYEVLDINKIGRNDIIIIEYFKFVLIKDKSKEEEISIKMNGKIIKVLKDKKNDDDFLKLNIVLFFRFMFEKNNFLVFRKFLFDVSKVTSVRLSKFRVNRKEVVGSFFFLSLINKFLDVKEEKLKDVLVETIKEVVRFSIVKERV